MRVLVMNVRVMGVVMEKPNMPVSMGMRFPYRVIRQMRMLMMLIMNVLVFVIQLTMQVFMIMGLTEV